MCSPGKLQNVQLHPFFIRTSKFCRGSLFLIFWLFQPQFVFNFVLISVVGLNDKKSKPKDKALKNNADSLYFEEISVHLSKITAWPLYFACRLSKSSSTGCEDQFFYCPTILQDSVKFQLKTFSLKQKLLASSSIFPLKISSKIVCIDKEPSNDSVAVVRSKNRFIDIDLVYVWHSCSEVHCMPVK